MLWPKLGKLAIKLKPKLEKQMILKYDMYSILKGLPNV